MNKSRKTKAARKGPKESRHHVPPSSLEAEALTLTNSSTQSPSWLFLLCNLSMETTITTLAFDKVVGKAIQMLQAEEANECPGLPTHSLALQELRRTVQERDLSAKQGRLANLLAMMQIPMDNPWNKAPGSLSLHSNKSNDLQRHNYYAADDAIVSELDPRLVGLGKQLSPNQLSNHDLDPRAMDLNNFIYGFTPFMKPLEYPPGGLDLPPTSLTGAQTPVGIFPAQNWADTSCFRALTCNELPPQCPVPKSVPQDSRFPWNDSTLPAPDFNHAMNRIVDLALCNPAACIGDPASTFIPTRDARDALNWSTQRLQPMPLSMPSASKGISEKLTPPKIFAEGQESTVKTTNPVVSSPIDVSLDLQEVRENGVSVEEWSEDKSMSLVVLTNAVLLSSGNRRCLVVPTDSQNAETAVNLTEADMEALISKGAAIPLSQMTSVGTDCLTSKDQRQGLDTGRAETGSLSGNDASSLTPRSCFEASDGTRLSTNFTPIKGLADILGKPILNMGKPLAGPSPSVGASRPFSNFEKGVRPNSQLLPAHNPRDQINPRNEKRKFVKSLIQSNKNSQGQQRDLFSISGFVDDKTWSQLPAIVGITSFEDMTNALNWFGKHELEELGLDRTNEDRKGEDNISKLYVNRLALLSEQPDFVMALVPTLVEQDSFDLKVFVKFRQS